VKQLANMTGEDLFREQLTELTEEELEQAYAHLVYMLERRRLRHRLRFSKMIKQGLAMPWDVANEIQRRDEEG
jgi:predicted N-acetyltransferase YhbS